MRNDELITQIKDAIDSIPNLDETARLIESGEYSDVSRQLSTNWDDLSAQLADYLSEIRLWIPLLLFTEKQLREDYLVMIAKIVEEKNEGKAASLKKVLRQALFLTGPQKLEVGDELKKLTGIPPSRSHYRFVIILTVELYRKVTSSKEEAINLVSETTKYGPLDYVPPERIFDWYDKQTGKHRRQKQLAVAIVDQWHNYLEPILDWHRDTFMPNQKLLRELAMSGVFSREELDQAFFLMRLVNYALGLIFKVADWQHTLPHINNGGRKLDLGDLWEKEAKSLFDLPELGSNAA